MLGYKQDPALAAAPRERKGLHQQDPLAAAALPGACHSVTESESLRGLADGDPATGPASPYGDSQARTQLH